MSDVDPVLERRLLRLREELRNERVLLPLEGPATLRLLSELPVNAWTSNLDVQAYTTTSPVGVCFQADDVTLTH